MIFHLFIKNEHAAEALEPQDWPDLYSCLLFNWGTAEPTSQNQRVTWFGDLGVATSDISGENGNNQERQARIRSWVRKHKAHKARGLACEARNFDEMEEVV